MLMRNTPVFDEAESFVKFLNALSASHAKYQLLHPFPDLAAERKAWQEHIGRSKTAFAIYRNEKS